MSRSDNDRLGDIIRACRRVAAIVGCGHDRFASDWTLQSAAAHEIEHLVEAVTRLSPSEIEHLGELPVAEMKAMRVHLAHIYWDVDVSILWDTMERSVPDILRLASQRFDPTHSRSNPYDEELQFPLM